MRKITAAAFIAAGVFFLVPALAVFLFHRGAGRSLSEQAQSAPQTALSAAAPRSDEAKPVSGQVIYDARAALPPQAMLDVWLTETDNNNRVSAIIAETRRQPDGTSPLSWTLPLKLAALDKNKSYSLQAKISSGDTLLFVNAAPTALDINRAAYIIRLAKIDDGSGSKTETRSLAGVEWRAAAPGNKAAEADNEISLKIDDDEKSGFAGGDKIFRAGGFSGCSRYQTAAALNEDKKSLQFSPIAGGVIACPPAAARREADFIAMMGKVRFYKIDESGALYLLDGGQNPLARFAARPQ